MKTRFAVALILVASGAKAADPAAPVAPRVSYVMAGNPHVPLAVVRGAVLDSAIADDQRGKSCGDASRWARRGSAWRAVDAWGHVTGTYRIDGSELYDATACREVSFVTPPAHEGALVYISADSPWREPTSARWTPTAKQRSDLATLAHGLDRVTREGSSIPAQLGEIAETTRFFAVPAASGVPTRMAVAGRCGGWLVASLADNGWKVVSRGQQEQADQRQCWRPLAVFDLTGDGIPEIVMRFIEGGGEWWGDEVLQRRADGSWARAALSGGGSTA